MSSSTDFETPIEASMNWEESDLPVRQRLREELVSLHLLWMKKLRYFEGEDEIKEFFTETEEKCFIKGYTHEGFESIKKHMEDMIQCNWNYCKYGFIET